MGEFGREKIVSNGIWRLFERFGARGVSLLVSIILARILFPEDYAKIALVTVFISIMNVFVDSGFGTALIQKKDADDTDFSTVFWFNMAMSIFVYLLLYLSAPLISAFYNDASLTPIMRASALVVLIAGVKNVQQAYVSRNMLFRKFFFATIAGTVIAAAAGIAMAYAGFGVWALVAQNIVNTLVDTIVLWFTVKWRPRLIWSYERFKSLFFYGWKLLASAILNTAYGQLWQLVIGKKYAKSDLAYYDRGGILPGAVVNNLNEAIDSVLFPTMSNVSDDAARVKAMTRRSITIGIYILAPMMIGMACVAPALVRVLYTEKWLLCVPFLQIFSFTSMFYPIHTANLNAIKALGRSDLFLKLEIAKKAFGLAVLLVTMNYGPLAMAYGTIVTCFSSQIINSFPNKKLLGYSYLEQLKDILPSIVLASLMGLIVSFVTLAGLSDILNICLQITTGVLVYAGFSWILKLEPFCYLWDLIRTFACKYRKGN